MEHDVLLPGDELAGSELRDDTAIEAALFEQVEPSEVRVRITQPRPADEALDLGVGERGVGVVDGELHPLFEHNPQREGVVLNLERVDERGDPHLAEFALGLGVEPAHRVPPA